MAKGIKHTGKRGQPRTITNGADLRMISVVPEPPAYFDEERRVEWNELCGILIARSDLSEGDLAVVEVMTNSICEYRTAATGLIEQGLTVQGARGGTIVNPLGPAKKNAEMQILTTAMALGLSPQSRRNLKHVSIDETEATGGDF